MFYDKSRYTQINDKRGNFCYYLFCVHIVFCLFVCFVFIKQQFRFLASLWIQNYYRQYVQRRSFQSTLFHYNYIIIPQILQISTKYVFKRWKQSLTFIHKRNAALHTIKHRLSILSRNYCFNKLQIQYKRLQSIKYMHLQIKTKIQREKYIQHMIKEVKQKP